MADEVTVETGNGTPQRVALELMFHCSAFGEYKTEDAILDLYARCLFATHGRRPANK